MGTREFAVICALFLATPAAAQPIRPDEIAGLVAWYDARTLYDRLRDGATVKGWRDASGNGHDLIEEGNGVPSHFRTLRVDEKPAVEIGKHSSFAVAAPFELLDHTIFLVYRSAAPSLGLFSALKDDQRGVVIAKDRRHHVIHSGTRDTSYNASGVGADFSITVLTRESGRLRGFVNGSDVSGENGTDVALEVGRLFHVALSRFVSRDAEGLLIADLIFYDRALEPNERRGVTEFLAAKYGLELSAAAPLEPEATPRFDWSGVEPQLRLTSSFEHNLNVEGLVLVWDKPTNIGVPFRHDPAQPTRIYCDRDARVNLSLRLRLRASAPDTRLRILALRNDSDYQPQEGATEADPATDGALTARFDVSLAMRAGDWVEIVVTRDGPAGTVTLVPGESDLRAVAE